MVTKRSHPTQLAARLRKAAAFLATVRGLPHRVVVAGTSMRPTFEPGDRLLVVPVAKVLPGHVVGVRDPRQPDRVLVKRVRASGAEGYDVRGDNEAASTDSRHFGSVRGGDILGRVVYRYQPPDRSGWIAE